MKRLRWQLIIIFLTGLVVGILLLGEQPNQLRPFATAEPEQGGIYTEALVGSLQRLNPLFDMYNPVDRDVNRLVFSGLVRFDSRGVPQPDLADSWGISQDGILYNFRLREGLTWHDGQPLTAQDVIFTIDLLRNGGDYIPQDVQKFWTDVVVDGNGLDLQFTLPEAFAPFLDYLSFGVLPQHLLGALPVDGIANSPFNVQPIGSGPYRFERLLMEGDQVSGVVLRGFDGYYGSKPFIEQIVFRYYPDASTAMRAYQEQQVQGINQITQDILPTALAEPNLAIYTGRKPELAMVLFNLKSTDAPFLAEAPLRKALMMAINRQGIIDRLLGGQGIVADSPIFPGTWASNDTLKRIEYDPDAALRLIKDEGYALAEGQTVRAKENSELRFTLLHPDDDLHRAVAEAIQKNWAELNVQVNLEALPYDQIIAERLQDRNYQAALVDLNLTRSPDPDPYPFWDALQATSGQNYSQWNNKVASEYLEQARIATDMTERARLYRNFQVLFMDDLPALPLYYPVYNYGIDQQVQGVRMGALIDPSDRFSTVTEWFLRARVGAAAAPTATSNP